MACSLQKLFTVGEEFEDEDFLSAVEDAENHCAGLWPVRAACLQPGPSKPQDNVPGWAPGHPPSCPPAPSEASGLPALNLCLPVHSLSNSLSRERSSVETDDLCPESPSYHQRRVALSGVRTPSSASCPGAVLENQQQGIGDFEQDEFDKVLADMELEGPGLEPELGLYRGAPRALPSWPKEDSQLAFKRAQDAELSQSGVKGPRPAAHILGIISAQDGPSVPHVSGQMLQPCWSPRTTGAPNTSAVSTQIACQKAWPQGSSSRASYPLLLRSSSRSHLPSQPCPSPKTGVSSKPRFSRLPTPSTTLSSPSTLGPGSFPRQPFPLRAPMSCGESPFGTPKGPQAALQTPVVTNRLVQLVSAASRTPQQSPCPGPHTKARRFPGPAGVLPHQHSARNLEEIMVSTPQTPTHGALAKLRTKVVTSSQLSVEEEFGQGPWLTMKSALGLNESDPTCFLCTYSIVMVLRKAALRQLPRNKVPRMAVMIKSLSRSAMDASAVFRDPTGEMQGTVHRLLLESHHGELKPGAVLLLKQVGVFSPSLRNHYLNVTPSNLVRIYCSDARDGGFVADPANSQDDLLEDEMERPDKGLNLAQTPETGVPPEEELPEADDLDGLLSELPEDFFCGTSTWGHPKAGQPP